MYRLLVKYNNRWVFGINEYATWEEARLRKEQLSSVGIKSKIVTSESLYK
jgi:hypothetical protein